jgi:hypothetical protein
MAPISWLRGAKQGAVVSSTAIWRPWLPVPARCRRREDNDAQAKHDVRGGFGGSNGNVGRYFNVKK